MLSYIILTSALLSLGSSLTRTCFATPNFSNTIITTNIHKITEDVSSGLMCVMLCLEMQDCVSVFYRQVFKRCQFHDVLFLSPKDGEEETGTEYYSLIAGSCPINYVNNRLLGLCYKQHLNKILYDGCVADCNSRGEHLIVIDSHEKQDHVRKQLTSSPDGRVRSYYIDGSDAVSEGLWLYHDGRRMDFFAWMAGFPSNATAEKDYIAANKENGDFLWRDQRKTSTHYYICEKDV